jgi:aryl-phospho-beta-D-glucosidase BglC (GH1 family)
MPTEVTNALEHQTYDMFTEWFSWLRRAGVPGYLGEHSVPNSEKGWPPEEVNKWLTLIEKVYRLLDQNATLITAVTAHVASHTTTGSNGLKIYGPDRDDVPLDQRDFATVYEQAAVVEAHGPTAASMRGMNISAGAMKGGNNFSTETPGEYGTDYVYPDAMDYEFLLSRGLNLARVPFRWERVQVRDYDRLEYNPALKTEELLRLRASFDDAAAVGMHVIPSLQNYGAYFFGAQDYKTIGSPELPISAYKSFWNQLARVWKDHPAVVGYDIMNEPYDLPGGIPTWEKASQAAVNGIRSRDANTRIWVSGYHKRQGTGHGLYAFVLNHPRPWITGTNFGYTSHAYYGPGAAYPNFYDDAVAYWERRGY